METSSLILFVCVYLILGIFLRLLGDVIVEKCSSVKKKICYMFFWPFIITYKIIKIMREI